MKGANLTVLLTTTVKDKNGKVVLKRTRQAKSFVIAFLQFLEVHTYELNVNVQDITDTTQSVAKSTGTYVSTGAVGDATLGIVIGTGTTPVANDDYAMETKIAHGVGATQMQYGAHSKVATQEVGANVDYVLQRTFVNGSGSTINVTEFGIMSTYSAYDFLYMHDVVTAVPVANGQTLTTTYTFRTTV